MARFFFFGLASLLAQVLLLREIAQVFGAHELSLAAALAAWLAWTAAGAALGSRGDSAFLPAALLFACAASLNLLAARLAPALLPALSQPGLFSILAGSALLCLPAGLANGWAAGAALRGRPAFFYAAEAAGAAAAGIFTVFYFRSFPGLEAAAVLAFAALPLAAALARPPLPRLRAAAAAAALLLALAAYAAPRFWTLRPPAPRPSRAAQTEGGRLAFAGGAVYEDGRLLTGAGDESLEYLAHLPLLALPKTGAVLLHGSGAFALLPEARKHRPEALHVAEPDRRKAAALGGAREGWELLPADIRALPPGGRYSAILNAAGAPENAALNRFYTEEYFRAAAALLEPGGVLAFRLPFAENYLPPETAYTAACVLAAARSAFPHVAAVPASGLLVLASASPLDLDPALLARRMERRGVKARAAAPASLPFLLHPYRLAWAAAELDKVKAPPRNSDLNPLAYFRFWRAWLSMVVSPGAFLGLAGLLLAGCWAALRLGRTLRFSAEERTAEAFLAGFWALAFETAVLLAFQARTGRLSPELGLMFSLFMAGAAGGAWLARGCGARGPAFFEAAAALLAAAAALWPQLALGPWGARLLLAAGGLVSGGFFACAARRCGGAVYAWDLLGGAAGGLAVAAFAAPLLGIAGAFWLAAAAAAAALAGGYFFSSKDSTVKE